MILLLIIISYPISSQSLRIGAGGGITNITAPDDYTKKLTEGGLGFGSEIHYGLKAKLGLPVLPLNIVGSYLMHSFSSEESGVEVTSGLNTIGIGAELILLPGPINPYVGLDLTQTTIQDIELKTDNETLKLKVDESRFGANLGAGLDIKILPTIDIDVSAKYSVFNLVGKDDDDEETLSAITLNATILIRIL